MYCDPNSISETWTGSRGRLPGKFPPRKSVPGDRDCSRGRRTVPGEGGQFPGKKVSSRGRKLLPGVEDASRGSTGLRPNRALQGRLRGGAGGGSPCGMDRCHRLYIYLVSRLLGFHRVFSITHGVCKHPPK